jgi:peptide/nickel transport system ATP-binding protein
VAFSLLRLLPDNAEILEGKVVLDGINLLALSEEEVRKFRWSGISMVFQSAMNALDPVYRVREQITEAMQIHSTDLGQVEARDQVCELLDFVGLDPAVMERYPHELSGGMRQRVIIAMALACDPKLLIADEPTTALDVIVQERILKELRQIQQRLEMGMIYISHDIAVIAEVSDYIGVMYAGKLVEFGSVTDIFDRPRHPYTSGLIHSFPSIHGEKRKLSSLPGEPPDLLNPPAGCRFHPRCAHRSQKCMQEDAPFEKVDTYHRVACWHPLEVIHE